MTQYIGSNGCFSVTIDLENGTIRFRMKFWI
jgi:hypothetical protein